MTLGYNKTSNLYSLTSPKSTNLLVDPVAPLQKDTSSNDYNSFYPKSNTKYYQIASNESCLSSNAIPSLFWNDLANSTSFSFKNFTGSKSAYCYSTGNLINNVQAQSSDSIYVGSNAVNQSISFTTNTNSQVYSMVNSTHIKTYYLPEAEEFTIGSSNHLVNYILLYLSGSGDINVSIGSTLWGSNIVANITVDVSESQQWYLIPIQPTNLSGSKNYYLNVFNVSGSVLWGYTSHPSPQSFNYIQDYWYFGGFLFNDDKYPDIYSIGYSSAIGPLQISISPTSATIDVGQSITLTGSATGGSGSYSYEWQLGTSSSPSG
ncbi:MAG: hypothetical protein QW046_04375, partial [Candidatus Micrarchaeaceae archaeon]